MKYCSKCLMPSTRPRITFDDCGVCSACRHHEAMSQHKQDWKAKADEFAQILLEIKLYKSKSGYDCIVPWSGGKDSSSIALKLKHEFGLNPLLVCFNPLTPTPVGQHNRKALLDLDFDCLYVDVSNRVSSYLSLRFLRERGNPKLHWDAGINSAIFKAAISYDIPYIFYAEHGETMFGGKVLHKSSSKIRDHEEVIEHQIGDYPENWQDTNVSRQNLLPYIFPTKSELLEANISALYFGYFFPWNVVENFRYVTKHIDFRVHPKGRTPGTITNFDSLDDYVDDVYYYLQYIKFGFGRAVRDLSRQIQVGEISREKAIEIAQAYDGEIPYESIKVCCDFWGIGTEEFWEIVDQHRPQSIWKKCEVTGGYSHLHHHKLYGDTAL